MIQNAKLKIQNGIDYHCHILPGLDDGAADMTAAVDIARVLADAGFSEVCCTPHLIRGSYEAGHNLFRKSLTILQRKLDDQGINLRLLQGQEYHLDEFLMGFLQDPRPIAGTEFLLVEIPDHAKAEIVKETLYQVRCSGYIPVIAHPERRGLFDATEKQKSGRLTFLGSIFSNSKLKTQNSKLNSPFLMDYLKDLGCLFQGNIGSFAGIYGESVRKRAIGYLQQGLYTCIGSDAHSARKLAGWLDMGLREVARHVGDEGLQALLLGLPLEIKGKAVGVRQ